MTDEQINKLIHEKLMGMGAWHQYNHQDHCSPNAVHGWRNIFPPPPNYCTDLNAVALAEAKVIEMGGYEYYILDLTRVTPYRGFCATARQRAEACLRAMDLWEEV